MAKEYTVRLGGKERPLFYDTPERRAIEHAFAFEGKPARMLELLQEHFRPDAPGSFEVQATILWAGIRASKKGLTVETVGEWITKELRAGRHIAELIAPALKAIGVSGCLGFTFDLEEASEDEPAPEEPEDEGGKAKPEEPPAS
jgi:hypothetical protein